jgi:hypothetical protein
VRAIRARISVRSSPHSFQPRVKAGQQHSIVPIQTTGRFLLDATRETHYRMAESQLQRMMQRVCTVRQVDVIVNPALEQAYEKKKKAFTKAKKGGTEILAFHGSTEQAYESIAKTNFDVSRLASNTGECPARARCFT